MAYIPKVFRRNSYLLHDDGTATLTITRNNGDQHHVRLLAEDVPRAQLRRWRYQPCLHGQYAYAATGNSGWMVTLGQWLLDVEAGDPDGRVVTYRNEDGLDCRRDNLLISTRSGVAVLHGTGGGESNTGEPNIWYGPVGDGCRRNYYRVTIHRKGLPTYCRHFRSLSAAVRARDAQLAHLAMLDSAAA